MSATNQPRSIGALTLRAGCRRNGTALTHLRQSGALRALFPRPADPLDLTAVTVNTAGGITGGDRYRIDAAAASGGRLTLTTQAAERIYRARVAEVARIRTRLSLGPSARLDWLPQETILYDGGALRRTLDIEMAADATALIVEPLAFGRIAMGERLLRLDFRDGIRLTRAGRLALADTIRLTGNADGRLASRFAADGAGAAATVIYAAPDADRFLPRLRDLMPPAGGVSLVRPGLLYARLLAPDSHLLRRALIPAIEALHGARLPKTWTI